MSKKPRLFIFSAPSGAGKTTLCQRLYDEFSDQFQLSISSTTRKPRGKEVDGKDYFFLTTEEFKAKIGNDEFAEWAEVHGRFYGTSKIFLEEALKSGKSVLLDIDVQGAEQLRKSFPQYCVSIFISPPSLEVLEKRLRSRATDDEASIQKRIENARTEMSRAAEFDHVVVNDELEGAYRRLKEIIFSKV